MKVYQEKQETVNTGIEITNYRFLQERAKNGLLELSMSLGIEIMLMMLEEDVTMYAGPKGRHGTAGRVGYRHGSEQTMVVMGGKKIHTRRPRVRNLSGDGELPLPTLAQFQSEDPLNEAIMARLLAGVSTRKYSRTIGDEDAHCTSKSEVSRRFIKEMDKLMEEFFTRSLSDDYPVIIIDGLVLGKMTILAAMGITRDGKKRMLGLIEGGSENSVVVIELLNDLIARGLDPLRPRLYVLDGGKALYKGVTGVFGKDSLIQRCQVHKKRNVLFYLPKSEQANTSKALTMAYREFDYKIAKEKLLLLANNLEYRYPKAAASLREGLEETLTVHRLSVPGLLRETLSSTNPLESANSVCRGIIRRVCNFKDGGMALRHAAAGFMGAEQGFHRVRGYKHMGVLVTMLEPQEVNQSETTTA